MASLKRSARNVVRGGEGKQDTSTNGFLELSVTVSFLAADVKQGDMAKLERLLHDHCNAGVVSLERGDMENHLHFQMVARARVKSARAFGILVRKYMGWHGLKNMNPVGKVMCKVLTNRMIHTWQGMIGYCLKDTGCSHFDTAIFNVSDDEIVAGKTMHSIYGKADLKSRVVITNKNIGERAYVWFKFRESRQLTATLLSTLTDMIRSASFIPASSWIIPFAGQGMDHRRLNSFWKCLVYPTNVDRADVADVFIRKQEYVRGRYWDEDVPKAADVPPSAEYHFQGAAVKDGFRVLPCSVDLPPFPQSLSARVKDEVLGRHMKSNTQRALFQEEPFIQRAGKEICFGDRLPDFIPLKDVAPLPVNVCLASSSVLHGERGKVPFDESAFWETFSKSRQSVYAGFEKAGAAVDVPTVAAQAAEDVDVEGVVKPIDLIVLSSDSEDDEPDAGAKPVEVILLSSDSEVEEPDAATEPIEVIVLSSDSEMEEDNMAKRVKICLGAVELKQKCVLINQPRCLEEFCPDVPCKGKCFPRNIPTTCAFDPFFV